MLTLGGGVPRLRGEARGPAQDVGQGGLLVGAHDQQGRLREGAQFAVGGFGLGTQLGVEGVQRLGEGPGTVRRLLHGEAGQAQLDRCGGAGADVRGQGVGLVQQGHRAGRVGLGQRLAEPGEDVGVLRLGLADALQVAGGGLTGAALFGLGGGVPEHGDRPDVGGARDQQQLRGDLLGGPSDVAEEPGGASAQDGDARRADGVEDRGAHQVVGELQVAGVDQPGIAQDLHGLLHVDDGDPAEGGQVRPVLVAEHGHGTRDLAHPVRLVFQHTPDGGGDDLPAGLGEACRPGVVGAQSGGAQVAQEPDDLQRAAAGHGEETADERRQGVLLREGVGGQLRHLGGVQRAEPE